MEIEDYEEFKNWVRGIKPSTQRQYRMVLNLYCKTSGLTPKQLIDEAEGDLKLPRRKRSAPQKRLGKFYQYLVDEHVVERGRRKGKKGISPYAARVRVGSLKSFYKENGYPLNSLRLPKAKPKGENQRLYLSPQDIRRMVEVAPSWRDKALILFGYQGAFDVKTVLKLDLGDFQDKDLEKLLKNEMPKTPILLHVVRKKEEIDYHTCLGHDAVDAFRAYLQERRVRKEELTLDSPAFVKEGSRKYSQQRVPRHLVHHLMREVAVKAGVVSRERLDRADFNIAGYHALRSTFSRRMQHDGFPSMYIEYCQGHSLPHNGAYRKPTPEQLLEKYRDYEETISISKAPKTYREVEEELRREIEKRDYQIEGMEQRLKAMEKDLAIIPELKENAELVKEIKVLKDYWLDGRLIELIPGAKEALEEIREGE